MNRNQAILRIVMFVIMFGLAGCQADSPPATVQPLATATLPPPTSEPTTEPTNQPTNEPTTPPTNEPTNQPTNEPTNRPTLLADGLTAVDPYAPELGNFGYDVRHYLLQLTVKPAQQTIAGTVTLTAVATEANLSELALDFIGYDIESVQVNGSDAEFRREAQKLTVSLAQPMAAGAEFTLAVTYGGSPVREPSRYVPFAESIGLFFSGNTAYVLAEPDGARYWFPSNDHPRDKALFRFEITVPEGLTAVANGQMLSEAAAESGHTIFVWEHIQPMAPYLATVVVGDYVVVDKGVAAGVPIRHYTFADDQAEFLRSTAVTGEAIEWMSELFGPYPFESFGFVTADVPNASLETQSMVLLSTNMLNQTTVIHELAHMWFGDWVSLDSWGEMWRNEGFATYVEMMWENRDDPEGLALQMAAVETAVEESARSFPLNGPPPESLFSFNTYFKGALAVHELRQTVGDDAFFGGLQLYFERYGGGTASDAEFQAVMEEAAGTSLEPFFQEWIR